MTKFRRHDRVRIEFEGEVINLVGHDEIDVAVTKEWTRTFKTKHATLLERPESTDERIARIERENAEMKARLAALGQPSALPFPDTPQTVSSSPEIVAEQARSTILIDKITRWFAKR